MSKPQKVLKDGQISSDQLEDIVDIALKSLKNLMVDYETPIEIRLQAALRVFEIFGAGSGKSHSEEVVISFLEKNAHDIEKNAHQLAYLETLLKLVTQPTAEPVYQPGTLPSKGGRIINH